MEKWEISIKWTVKRMCFLMEKSCLSKLEISIQNGTYKILNVNWKLLRTTLRDKIISSRVVK